MDKSVPPRVRVKETVIPRNTWKWVVCACAGGVLAWGIYRLTSAAGAFDWKLFLAGASRLRWTWLAVGLIPIGGTYVGRALRWAVFLRPLKPKPSMANLLSATVVGFSAIALFGRAGEFVRPYLIAVKERVPVPSQMAAWFLERLFDILMALLCFAYALARVAGHQVHSGSGLAWVLAFGGRVAAILSGGALVLLLSMRHLAEPFANRVLHWLRFLPEKQHERAKHLVTTFLQGIESTRSDGALLMVLAYSILEWVLIAACYWCLAQSFSGLIQFSVADVLVFVGFVSFGSTIQIPGIGGGVQVVAVLVMTELFGVRVELATFFALVLWIFIFVVVVPVGLAVGFKEGLTFRGLRRISRGESL